MTTLDQAGHAGNVGEAARTVMATAVRRHALGWLVGANVVGVGLAAALVWPAAADHLAPFTYGRWMPVHLNGQLYGWGALPLVGLLIYGLVDPRHPGAVRQVRLVLAAWTAALLGGVVSWLAGVSSGKLFLDWHGWARPLLPAAMTVLWTVLAAHVWWRRGQGGWGVRFARALGVLALAPVPAALYWSAGREVYPAVNPHSGGATGAALLISTLAIVAVFALLPTLLGVPAADQGGRKAKRLAAAWIGSLGVWLLLAHGNSSHHEPAQIAGLAVLLAWIPLLAWWWRAHRWSDGARPWVAAAWGWWAVLVVTGWLTFLPGFSERMKFTNGLVGHAHLAMAGLMTSVNLVILNQMDPARPLTRGFGLWQATAALHVGVLMVLGVMENADPEGFFAGASWVRIGYGLRLAAGLAMAVASVRLLGETRNR